MMNSVENFYIETDNAVGFRKDYKGSDYSFAALLPNEGVDIYDFIASLTGESLNNMLSRENGESVNVSMPKFSAEYKVAMQGILADLGMKTAFDADSADFGRLTRLSDNIYIDQVLHKTFIDVNERGTRAGAASAVLLKSTATKMPQNTVILDRPFVYMIMDNSTNLPLFIGTALDIGK